MAQDEWAQFRVAPAQDDEWAQFRVANQGSVDAADVAKSAGIGAAKGGIGMAGLSGDLREAAASGAGALTGISPESVSSVIRHIPLMGGPTSKQLQSGIESVTGKFYEPQTVAGEYARTAGEFLPAAVGGGGGIAARAARVAVPAITSETMGQATKGEAIEPYARAAGGFAGPVVASGARRLVTPMSAPSAERQAAVDILRREGVEPSAGQVTGSRPLQWFEQSLGDLPGAGKSATTQSERVAEQFTSAALKRAGVDAKRATPEVIDDAFSRIGNEMDNLASRHSMVPDAKFRNDIRTAIDDYRAQVSPPNRAPIIDNFEQEVATALAKNNGVLPGDIYQSLRSRLERAARRSSDAEVSDTLRDIKGALDSTVERNLARKNSPDLGEWRKARGEYRNLLVIERAATAAGGNAAEGLISPSALRNATINVQGRRNYARGNGDFAELVRAGEAVMRPLPNSGTASRTYAQGIPAGVAGTMGALMAGLPGAAIGGVGALVAPPLMGRALMSGPVQRYLSNRALPAPGGLVPRAAIAGLLGSQ